MKRELSFWHDLESYTWKISARLSPALPWLGTGIVLFAITISMFGLKESMVGAHGLVDGAMRAAKVGDYVLARRLYEKQYTQEDSEQVRGVRSEAEELIFPERQVEREIARYEDLLNQYPGHRDIYLALAQLYSQIKRTQQAELYYNLARELDPNNSVFSE